MTPKSYGDFFSFNTDYHRVTYSKHIYEHTQTLSTCSKHTHWKTQTQGSAAKPNMRLRVTGFSSGSE